MRVWTCPESMLKTGGENIAQKQCTKCGRLGHNVRTCDAVSITADTFVLVACPTCGGTHGALMDESSFTALRAAILDL